MGPTRAETVQRTENGNFESSDLRIVVEDLKKQQADARADLTLIKSPIQTFKYFLLALKEQLYGALFYALKSRAFNGSALLLLLAASTLVAVEGPQGARLQEIIAYGEFALWWLCLGIASSIGLGSGLHTFVLYLGPHIARFTMKATACGRIDLKRSPYDTMRWGIDASWGDKECSQFGPPLYEFHPSEHGGYYSVPALQLIQAVQLEAILWGIGTAIGELPPYFVSRAARLSGERVKELEELERESEGGRMHGLFQRLKLWMFSHANQLGFFAILAFASIPNPLFDLAGITCGHFLVPFWKFFSATLIGKSIVKTHMQTILVVTVFNSHTLEILESMLEKMLSWTPLLSDRVPQIMSALDNAREKLSGRKTQVAAPSAISIASAWNTFVLLMLAAFVASIVSSMARGHLIELHNKELKSLEERLRDSGAPLAAPMSPANGKSEG